MKKLNKLERFKMDLLTKTKEELLEYAKRLNLKVAKNITEDTLRRAVETEAIRQTETIKQTERLKLEEKSRMNRDLAEIRAEAEVRGVSISIPPNPTITDVVKLKKQLNLAIKEPKPSPETVAIETSKKVYAVFHNMEQKDMDITCNPGGKHWFHLWPEKVHVLPEWLIDYWRRTAVVPIYDKKMVPNPQSVEIGGVVEKSKRVGSQQRFLFDILGDAPPKASFGVVLDEKTLSKLIPQPVF